jgi:hypothetical protein
MTFALLCMTLLALLFGIAVAFAGYRLFLILLPIWGFFGGFFLGAQAITAIFGGGFLSTITGWVIGFIVGLVFAVLAYLFYVVAVAIISFSFGYGATTAILAAIGLNFGFLVWIIAVVVGVVVAFVVLRWNLAKYAIIVITAIGGAGAIIYTLLGGVEGASPLDLVMNPVQLAIQSSFWWLLFFLVVAVAGIVVQIRANQGWEVEQYDRFTTAM